MIQTILKFICSGCKRDMQDCTPQGSTVPYSHCITPNCVEYGVPYLTAKFDGTYPVPAEGRAAGFKSTSMGV